MLFQAAINLPWAEGTGSDWVMGIPWDDVVVIQQGKDPNEPCVVTVNCPDKAGLGCDLCRIILEFGLRITRAGISLLPSGFLTFPLNFRPFFILLFGCVIFFAYLLGIFYFWWPFFAINNCCPKKCPLFHFLKKPEKKTMRRFQLHTHVWV